MNIASHTYHEVGDFYDVIGRVRSISTRQSAIFMMSMNMKFTCLGYRECLILSFLATKA